MPERAWWDGPLAGLDLETTAADPEVARIVTAAFVRVGPAGAADATDAGRQRDVRSRTWLADPGVEIPAEATAVHGITTEHAREHGRDRGGVIREVLECVLEAIGDGVPLIVFNARYDLTVLSRRGVEHFGALGDLRRYPRLRVVCPATLDKWLDTYRKSYPAGHTPESAAAAGIASSRTLTGMCAHYRVTLDGAHDAAFDALAGVRLAYRMCAHADVVRNVRTWGGHAASDRRELAAMRAAWARVRGDLDRLHEFQRDFALEERERFAEYKASIGEHDEAARIRAEVGWPVLEPRAAVAA